MLQLEKRERLQASCWGVEHLIALLRGPACYVVKLYDRRECDGRVSNLKRQERRYHSAYSPSIGGAMVCSLGAAGAEACSPAESSMIYVLRTSIWQLVSMLRAARGRYSNR